MAKSKDLYDLIHSLTTIESNFISAMMEIKGAKSKKRYYKHFMEISKMKVFNELVWKKKLSYGKSIKSMVWTNTYLYNFILKALNLLRDESGEKAHLIAEIQKIDILIERGLYDQAYQFVKSAKEYAKTQQMFELCMEVINSEFYMLQLTGSRKDDITYDHLNDEWQEVNEAAINLRAYRKLENDSNALYRKHHAIRNKNIEEEYLAFASQPLLQDFSLATTLRSKFIFLRTNLVLNSFLGNKEKAVYYSKLGIEFLKSYGEVLVNPMYSCGILVRDIELIIIHERWEHFEEIFSMYLALEPRMYNQPYFTFWNAYRILFIIQFYYYTKDFARVEQEIERIDQEKFNATFCTHSSIAHLTAYTIAKYYRKIGNHKASMQYLDMIIANQRLCRRDMLVAVKLLELINHYECGDFTYLPYAIKSTYRFLKKMEYLYNGEKCLLQFLGKVIKMPLNDALEPLFLNLLKELRLLRQDKYEQDFFYYFDYISWIESSAIKNTSLLYAKK
ncbi:MAG: hypothetical protein R2730_00770 [Chitinophagales bacterium]